MSPCSDCITSKKENEKETEPKHSKYNGNLNQDKNIRTVDAKSTKAKFRHLESTTAAPRPRIPAGRNIRRNRPAFDSQCSDPDCPFNRTRMRQTMPSLGRRTRAPRRTKTHRNAGGGNSRPRRVRRTQSYLPPPPDVTPPRPPRTPLPPFPRQKSFIHDKYITTENTTFYTPSPSPEPVQFRHQDTLPLPQVDTRTSVSQNARRPSAGEEVLKVLRRLKPLKKSNSKESSNSDNLKDQDDAYASSCGSSRGDLTSNTTPGYIPPPPPMPPHLLSYRNVLKPSKKNVPPKEKTKPITVVDMDSSKKTNLTSKLGQFKRFHKKVRKQDSITVLDVQTNQKYKLDSGKQRKNKGDRKDISIVKI